MIHALETKSVSKCYGATVALESVSIGLLPGEVHALLGENGAGKSTLVKLLSGVVSANSGAMTLLGRDYHPQSILEARAEGVATAFQELSLVPNLTVAQNLSLPRQVKGVGGFVSVRETEKKASFILDRFALLLDPAALVGELTLAQKQRLEIVRALSCEPKVLILDEPTAALSEVDWLFRLIREFAQHGTSVLYISHRLAEVRSLCQRATVLRNGRSIDTVSLDDSTDDDIFTMMVGHERSEGRQKRRLAHDGDSRPTVLGANEIVTSSVRGISFELKEGEILGVAGLEGQGQRDLFRSLVGLVQLRSGTVEVDGRRVRITGPDQALRAGRGIAFVPEERKTEGIFPTLSTASNIVLPISDQVSRAGLIWERLERDAAGARSASVDLSKRYLDFRIGELSGGNQQKALLARAMGSGARILLLYDPTRGVDVGTKESIYEAIRQFADSGGSVLFYSSELPELTLLADRCIALYGGLAKAELAGNSLTERKLVAAMTGHGEDRSRDAKVEAA